MNGHIESNELQDFREGLLSPDRREAVRNHLEKCPACRADLEALAELMGELADLPQEAFPARDLWPQIEWRIHGSTKDEPRSVSHGKVSLRVWQLMAASVTIALISGGAVWAFLGGSLQPAGPGLSLPATMAEPAGLEAGYAEYDAALSDLEEILEKGKGVLDDQTLRVLEENLTIIDNAIAESREALLQDPQSKTLRRILSETMRRKVDLLQQAAAAVYANT